jgi:hypothetical protein
MPRREILTSSDRVQLLAFPEDEGELIRRYTLTKADLGFVRQHRGDHNRLGIAVQILLSVRNIPFLEVCPKTAFTGLESEHPIGSRSRQGCNKSSSSVDLQLQREAESI